MGVLEMKPLGTILVIAGLLTGPFLSPIDAESYLGVRFKVTAFRAWQNTQLTATAGFAAMVREILTVPVDRRLAAHSLQRQAEVSPVGFYQANQLKPENLAAGAARMFLGVR